MPNIEIGKMPRHIALIMDGNGRWAKERGLPRTAGHRAGAEALGKLVRDVLPWGVEVLTVYAFSTENWRRSKDEVDAIFGLIRPFFEKYLADIVKHGIALRFLGDLTRLPADVQQMCETCMRQTAANNRLTVNIALNYGGRAELVRAARLLAEKAQKGELDPARIDETTISDHLYTCGQPDVDLIIRTAGETRLSGFLLYQSSYAEFLVSDRYWPDFDADELARLLDRFKKTERRYGAVQG